MYFKALQDCSFGGETFKAGDMIDLGDKESIAKLQRELGDVVEVTTPEKMAEEQADANVEAKAAKKQARADAKEARAEAKVVADATAAKEARAQARADAKEAKAEAEAREVKPESKADSGLSEASRW